MTATATATQTPIRFSRAAQGRFHPLIDRLDDRLEAHLERLLESDLFRILAEMQRFRGKIYRDDVALGDEDLDATGRHVSDLDRERWHVLAVDENDEIRACINVHAHHRSVAMSDLTVARAIERSDRWTDLRYRLALEAFLACGRQENRRLCESGGWAVAPEVRGSVVGIVLVEAACALCELLGPSLMVCTAGTGHGSSRILSRLGGMPLDLDGEALPTFHDPAYHSDIQVLTFDSRRLAERYAPAVRELMDRFRRNTRVLAARIPADDRSIGSGAVSA